MTHFNTGHHNRALLIRCKACDIRQTSNRVGICSPCMDDLPESLRVALLHAGRHQLPGMVEAARMTALAQPKPRKHRRTPS